MPLLPQEPFLFPDNLLTPEGLENLPDGEWWVLHTRPRSEKALARRCLDHRLRFFLPVYLHKWRNQGRLHRSYLPLFPGYLFLHGDFYARTQALTTNLIARTLAVPDQRRLTTDLERVLRLITSDLPLTPESHVKPGMRVEVVAGPFAGMEGTVVRVDKGLKFIVDIHFLGQGVSVEIERANIQPLSTTGTPALAGGLTRTMT